MQWQGPPSSFLEKGTSFFPFMFAGRWSPTTALPPNPNSHPDILGHHDYPSNGCSSLPPGKEGRHRTFLLYRKAILAFLSVKEQTTRTLALRPIELRIKVSQGKHLVLNGAPRTHPQLHIKIGPPFNSHIASPKLVRLESAIPEIRSPSILCCLSSGSQVTSGQLSGAMCRNRSLQ